MPENYHGGECLTNPLKKEIHRPQTGDTVYENPDALGHKIYETHGEYFELLTPDRAE